MVVVGSSTYLSQREHAGVGLANAPSKVIEDRVSAPIFRCLNPSPQSPAALVDPDVCDTAFNKPESGVQPGHTAPDHYDRVALRPFLLLKHTTE